MRKFIEIIIVFTTLLAGCSRKKEKHKNVHSVPVTVQEVKTVLHHDIISVSGNVEPLSKVNLGFMVPGKIRSINIIEGEHVRAGQLIARLDTADCHFALQIASARKQQAFDQYKRLRQMYEKKSLTPSDYVKVREAYRQAKANYELNKKHLRDTRLCTPLSGIVGAKRVDKGEIVDKGLPLFTIVNTDSVKVNVAVPESAIDLIRKGEKAKIKIPALDTTFDGKVLEIGELADPASRTYSVKILVKNKNLRLKTGMIAEAYIKTNHLEKRLTIPGDAIIRTPENELYSFIVDAHNGRVYKRRVFVKGFQERSMIITKGLRPGELVVTEGQNMLRDGDRVKILKNKIAEK